MRTRFFAGSVLGAFALAGCTSLPDPKPVAPAGVLAAESVIASPAQLAGHYRVAGIQGVDFTTLRHGFSVSITDSTIAVDGNCLNLRWSYRFDGSAIVTQAVPGPACRRAPLPEETALAAAFAGAHTVRHAPRHGIVFAGPGGTVTLFSH